MMCKVGKRILIIEDTDSIALLIQANLRQEGYFAEVAGTIKHALNCFNKAASGPVPYDLLLLDLNLPDGEGVSVLERLNSLENCPPIFIISADGSQQTKDEVHIAGAAMFFEKPFDFPQLKRAIETHIGHKKPEHYAVRGADLEAERKILTDSYLDHLLSIAEQLQSSMPYDALTSLLHQLKGSANLYGFKRLSELSTSLGEQLACTGPRAANEVRTVLRQELMVGMQNNPMFAR